MVAFPMSKDLESGIMLIVNPLAALAQSMEQKLTKWSCLTRRTASRHAVAVRFAQINERHLQGGCNHERNWSRSIKGHASVIAEDPQASRLLFPHGCRNGHGVGVQPFDRKHQLR